MRVSGAAVILGSLLLAGCGATAKQEAKEPPAAPSPQPEAEAQLDPTPIPEADHPEMRRLLEHMNAGKFQDASALCDKLLEKYPHKEDLVFQKALVYRMMGEAGLAVETLSPYEDSLSPRGLSALASALDESGDPQGALRVTDAGIVKHPKSGRLYSTKGTTLAGQGNGQQALGTFMQGVDAEPTWPSNHLQIAVLLSGSDLGALTLLHGEMFRNLEPGSERSEKMAGVMFQTISERITMEKDENGKESGSVRLVAGSVTGGDPNHPLQVFELAFGLPFSLAAADGFTFEEVVSARNDFVKVWWERTQGAPHSLASFLHAVDESGNLEAYHVWLFAPIDPAAAKEWADVNPGKMEALGEYLSANPLQKFMVE